MEITGHYSHHARRAMLQARACARQQRHALLDTGHLLVGILRAEGSLGQRVLRELALNPEDAEHRLAKQHPHARQLPADLPFSDALQDTLRFAAEESHLLGHHYIGTEHLLLGLVRSGGGSARPILHASAISLDQIRRQVRRVWQEGQTEIGLEKGLRLARLSELSRRVLSRANMIADDYDQHPVDLMHLLLALAQEKRSPGALTLPRCGLNQTALQDALRRPHLSTATHLEEVLDEAVFYAEQMGSHYTGTDHIIMALARHERGMWLLLKFRVDVERLQREVTQLLHPRH